MYRALRDGDGFLGTIEFFPQEGKYHYDGHRKCGVRWDPLETVRHGGICPECGKPVTRGVMYRVAELADRQEPEGGRPSERSSRSPSSRTCLPSSWARRAASPEGDARNTTA